jgi:tetratricopeptide (TPR) repeat protein
MASNRPREALDALFKKGVEPFISQIQYSIWDRKTFSYHMLGKHKQALREAKKGREEYPDFYSTLWYEIRALAFLGKIEKIYELLDECLRLKRKPTGAMIAASEILYFQGFKDASRELADRAVEWYKNNSPQDISSLFYQRGFARALYCAGHLTDAREAYKKLEIIEKDPINIIFTKGVLGKIAARLGDRKEAMRISEELKNMKHFDLFYGWGLHTYKRACIAALLGDKEQAMTLLQEAYKQGVRYAAFHIRMDLEPLRDYPPFKEFMKPKG